VYEREVDLIRRIVDADGGSNCLDHYFGKTRSVMKGARTCIEAEGEHFEHLLQK
jgi:hypothetical protein